MFFIYPFGFQEHTNLDYCEQSIKLKENIQENLIVLEKIFDLARN
jgi:hypothetical protein